MNKEIPTKKELQGSNRWYKSATPKQDLSWYIKGASSFTLLSAMMLRGAQILPTYDLTLSFIGCVGWLYVGILWKDRALVLLNTAASLILGIGLLRVIAGV